MIRLALFVVFVVFVVAVILLIKTIYDKHESKNRTEKNKDELDKVVSSWETGEN